jgi:uncharacterized membrane protein YdbT with pleckstrin-like domain
MSEKVTSSAGPTEPEQTLWEGGYSWKAMVGGWILSLLVTIAAMILAAVVPFPILWFLAAMVALALWGGHVVMFIYQRLGVAYKLTTQRFVHGSGVFQRTTDRIEVIDIDDVQVRQSFVERFLGVGTIRLLSSDTSTPALEMKGIDEVNRVATLIDDTRRTERRKRSVHIETV